MIKKLLGIAPQPTAAGTFEPSLLSLRLATVEQTDYDHTEYDSPYTGPQKILVLCTEEGQLEMTNGKRFATGNHPVELFVPLLHLNRAGFAVDFVTLTGRPVQIEEWALPRQDTAVMDLYAASAERLAKPLSLEKLVERKLPETDEYLALFIPGGHGALLGLPASEAVHDLLHWAHERELFLLSICHGPAALLAAHLYTDEIDPDFLYAGYQIAAFPDSVDKLTPLIGYLPGRLPWYFGKKLKELGVTIVNSSADKTCHRDRTLITGASPQAANEFGKLAARALLAATREEEE